MFEVTFSRKPFAPLAHLIVPALLGLTLATGCQRQEIAVYWIPKEEASSGGAVAAQPQTGITWKTPPGWQEEPAGEMRAARFTVGSSNRQTRVEVIPLTGFAASDFEVVNLWRSTLDLPPLEESNLSEASVPVDIGGEKGRLFEMVSDKPLIEGKFPARLVVAVFEKGGTAWFFKMMGEESVTRGAKPGFLEFLKSIAFATTAGEVKLAESQRPVSTNLKTAPGRPAAPEWKVPGNWRPQPASAMRLASFLVEGRTGQAEVSVTVFAGDGGGTLANVNRWRGQIALPPVNPSDLPALAAPLDPALPGALSVDLTGEAKEGGGSRQRIVAAIVPYHGRTWFYKLMGDSPVVEGERAAFLDFVKNVKYPETP